MFPTFAQSNSGNQGLVNAKLFSYFGLFKMATFKRPNVDYISGQKFVASMALSIWQAIVSDSVKRIFFFRAPLKVFNSIIGPDAIKVSAFHANWFWSDKRKKNQAVSPKMLSFAIFCKTYFWPLVSFGWSVGQESASRGVSWKTFYVPKAGNFIEPFVSRHVFPNFHVGSPMKLTQVYHG